jgi:hypothetical protein
MKKNSQLPIIDRLYLVILLVIFGGIVLHAPLSVGLGTLFPNYDLLIKSWKEILMGVALVLVGVIVWREKRFDILKEPLMVGLQIYAGLHVLSLIVFRNGLQAILAGLMIDLRYILFFTLVYLAVRLFPQFRRPFIRVGIIGAVIVVGFALLQVFILPADVLKYIGYNVHNIAPYLTVDQNHQYIRINSTLRGPNPLGAYAVIVLASLGAWLIGKKPKIVRHRAFIVAVLLLGGIVALWASYSRSALIAAVVAGVVLLSVTALPKLGRRAWIVAAVIVFAIAGGLVATSKTSVVSNVLLHENPTGGSSVNSNEGHLSSLQDGLLMFVREPFGSGVGSTGSASFMTSAPLIIENQYLFVAHEVGWLGLILFLMIFIGVMSRLWQLRTNWLALGVFASGLGLAIIGLLLPVWVDDTVAIVWWGLAAFIIGGGEYERHQIN